MSRFLATFLRDKYVAAVLPSSRHLAVRVIAQVMRTGGRTVVEFGPGDGAVTKPLLAALPADARYTAIERNPAFVAHIRAIGDPRLSVVEGSATDDDVLPPGCADAVIASIPFSMLTSFERDAVLGSAVRLLRKGGVLVVFHQYTPVMRGRMRRAFGNVHTEVELRNVFPCFVFVSEK